MQVGVQAVLQVNPILSTLAMEFIATWSYVDLELTHLTTRLATTDFEILSEMLSTLRGGRTDAIAAAVRVALADRPRDFFLFNAVLKKARAVEKRRNRYAHCLWGINPSTPENLVLVNHNDLAHAEALESARAAQVYREAMRLKPDREAPMLPPRYFMFQKQHIEIVTKKRLQSDLAMARGAHDLAYILRIALFPWPGQNRDKFYSVLEESLGTPPG